MQDIEDRLRFYGLDAKAQRDLKAAFAKLEPLLPRIVDRFYRHVRATPEAARHLEGHSIERLKAAQTAHWTSLLQAQFDQNYIRRAQAIGRAHLRVGLDQKWHFGGYAFLIDEVTRGLESVVASKADLARFVSAATRAILLDIDVAVTVSTEHTEAQRLADMRSLADMLDERVVEVVTTLKGAAERLDGASGQMRTELGVVEERASAVAAAAAQASSSVRNSAEAAKELASCVGEIAQQVHTSRRTTTEAVNEAGAASSIMAQLSDAARQVEAIVAMIASVASQTNLLALNATIEAARAGDAGRGFAVVAAEVKALASQTAHATEEISAKVAGIQAAASQAVQSINRVATSIARVDEASVAISCAIEEQSATANQIGAAAQEAAAGAADVSRNIALVAGSARATHEATAAMVAVTDGLSGESQRLDRAISAVLSELRNGPKERAQATAAKSAA